MKRLKFYVSMCLAVCMLITACPAVFADFTGGYADMLVRIYGSALYGMNVSDNVYTGYNSGVDDYIYADDHGVDDYIYSFNTYVPDVDGYVYDTTPTVPEVSDYVYNSKSYGITYGLSWLMNPAEGVSGSVYTSLPYGFIIHDYPAATSAFVSDTGVHIPSGSRNFNHIDKNGLIEYYEYAGNIRYGIMDMYGNDIVPAGTYNTVKVLSADRFVCSKFVSQKEVFGIIDKAGNVIVPFEYSDMQSMGTVVATSMDGSTKTVFDGDGNYANTYKANSGNILPLPVSNSYLIITGTTIPRTTIMNVDGSTVAILDSFELDRINRESNELYGYKKYIDGKKNFCIYDMNGKLVHLEDEYGNVVYDAPSRNKNNSAYIIGTVDNCDLIADAKGKIIYKNPDVHMLEICNQKFVKVAHKSDSSLAILDFEGNEIVPYGAYSNITYCQELGILALEKDNKVSIGVIRPITVKVNGKNVEFDQLPVIKDSRTLVPLRAIFEALGAAIDWNNDTQTVTATHGTTTVKLTINSDIMTVNGNQVQLDVPAEALNGRTLVPVRAISEAFGCNVEWNQDARCVVISAIGETTKEDAPATEPTEEAEPEQEVEEAVATPDETETNEDTADVETENTEEPDEATEEASNGEESEKSSETVEDEDKSEE